MMQDDYLFNKTGGDAELEKLENMLSRFRYCEDAPPKLPAAVEASDKPSRWRSSFSFAFAAGCTAVVVLTLWMLAISRFNGPQRTFVSEPPEIRQATPSVVPAPKPPVSDPAKTNKQDVKPVFASARPKIPLPRRVERQASELRPKRETVALTKEEKHAYEQLMLALSIAGSRLKAVHDTIQGIEDPDSSDSKIER